jgi:hypothetical protein
MLMRPLRRAPMMLGGVGFQAGLDQARRAQLAARQRAAARPTPDIVAQLKDLKTLLDDGALEPEEFRIVKRKLLDDVSRAGAGGQDVGHEQRPVRATS